MRKQYTGILKQFSYKQLIHTREERRLTQAQIARLLEMEERSYVNLDHGKSGCSSLTLARFLIYCCDDPKTFLEQLRFAFEQGVDDAA